MIRCDRPLNRRGGGILVYFALAFAVSLDTTLTSPHSIESVWCKVTYAHWTFVIGCLYRPPVDLATLPAGSMDSNQLLVDNLEAACLKYAAYPLLICGDFNYPNINWHANSFPTNLDKFRRALELYSLYQHVREPTREGAILDLLLTNDQDMLHSIDYLEPFHNSDHTILEARITSKAANVPQMSPTVDIPQFRMYSTADWLYFSHFLSSMDWQPFWQASSAEERWTALKLNIFVVLNACIPLQQPTLLHKRKCPWYNSAVRQLRSRKRNLWISYLRSPNVQALLQYRLARNQFTAAMRNAQRQYEETLVTRCAANPKLFFQYANSHITNRSQIPKLSITDGSTTQNIAETATALNKHFVSVFTTADSNSECSASVKGMPGQIQYRFDLQRVRLQLLKLHTNKAVGPDGIHNIVLKNNSYVLAPYLTALFQLSLDTGVVPSEWKVAHVTPIHKSGRLDLAENYRPISLTSCVCRLMERFIYDWISEYLRDNVPLCASQHGFQRAQSCTSQLLEYFNDVTLSLDRRLCVDVIYLDFSKAFDKVHHSRLLTKLQKRGIPQLIVNWIESFLLHRQQRVVLGTNYSDWAPVSSGVPQGSVLGPLLFNIYVDDIDAVLHHDVKIKKFADDTKLYVIYSAETAATSTSRLQTSLDALSGWCVDWLMQLNITKCNVMYFGVNNPCTAYSLNGQLLTRSTNIRDLGITVSESGRVSDHCLKTAAAARRLTGLMLRTFRSRKHSIVVPLLKTIIRPVLEYATPVWNPCLLKDIAEIENVQRKITKCVHGLRGLSYSDRLKHLGLPTLQMRRQYFDMLECYKIVNGLVRSECAHSLHLSNINTRGNNCKLVSTLPPPKHNIRKHYFVERILSQWNALPADIIQQSTYKGFKSALRKHLHI